MAVQRGGGAGAGGGQVRAGAAHPHQAHGDTGLQDRQGLQGQRVQGHVAQARGRDHVRARPRHLRDGHHAEDGDQGGQNTKENLVVLEIGDKYT